MICKVRVCFENEDGECKYHVCRYGLSLDEIAGRAEQVEAGQQPATAAVQHEDTSHGAA